MCARLFSELRFLSPLRSMLAEYDASRQVSSVEKTAAQSFANPLKPREISGELKCRERTFFILGSGASVENLVTENFAEISTGVSVGINAWVLHDFVPDMYAYEPVQTFMTDHYRTLSYLDRPSILAARPLILVLRPRNRFELDQLDQVPDVLRDRVRLYGRVSPYTRIESNLRADLPQLARSLSRRQFAPVLLDSGASIIRMAHLGLKLGSKRIVFVGVDLNNVDYFWERNPGRLVKYGIPAFQSGQTGQTHETMRKGSRPFPVDTMVEHLARVAKHKFSCEFAVASPDSVLAKVIPVHKWRTPPK